MSECAVQGEDGSFAMGEYDGYGRVQGAMGSLEVADQSGHFAMWHRTCLKLLCQPEYDGPSESARDQGMSPADEFPEPRNIDDLRALRELAEVQARKQAAAAERREACLLAEDKLMGDGAECPHCRYDTFFVVEKKGVLAVRCPNPDCRRLRTFPVEKAEAWRALAVRFPEETIIWDDRKIGPHFIRTTQMQKTLERYRDELLTFGEGPAKRRFSDGVTRLERELVEETQRAEALERAEHLQN